MENELLKEVATYLKSQHYISTDYDFSQIWLNKSSKYYGMLKCSGRTPSAETAIHLSLKLKERGIITSRNQPEIGKKLISFSNQVLKQVIPAAILQ
jgi:hypothetical protein